MKKTFISASIASVLAMASASALAAGPDFTAVWIWPSPMPAMVQPCREQPVTSICKTAEPILKITSPT